MANTVELPNLKFFQWQRPNAANPRLSIPLGLADDRVEVTNPPLDENGDVITGDFIFGVRNVAGYVENIYVPPGEVSVDGLTFTNVVRGINLTGLDYNTSVPELIAKHEQDSPVFCNVTAVYESILAACIRGETVRTNGLDFILGQGSAETVTISRDDGTVRGWLRYTVADGVQYSNDGSTWVNISPAASSSLVAITAADTSPGYLDDKLVLDSNNLLTKTVVNPGAGETLRLTLPQTVIQNNTTTYAGTTGGTSTAYTATITPAPSAYAEGQIFQVKIHATSGANPTINFNGLGAVDIVDENGDNIVPGLLPANSTAVLAYINTEFQLINFVVRSEALIFTQGTRYGTSTTRFDITIPVAGRTRFTYDGTGTNPNINTTNYPAGALVSLWFDNGVKANSRSRSGIFEILASDTNWFEVPGELSTGNNQVLGSRGFIEVGLESFTIPATAKSLKVVVYGAGGSGQDGGGSDTGGIGGAGGAMNEAIFDAQELRSLSTTVPILVGRGGVRGSSAPGGVSSFGRFLEAYGGYSSNGDSDGGGGQFGCPGGGRASFGFVNTPSAPAGGAPILSATVGVLNAVGGSGAATSNNQGGCAEYGGAGSANEGIGGKEGGSSIHGAGAGGGGGRGQTEGDGLPGGSWNSYVAGTGALGGTTATPNGQDGTSRSGYGAGDGGGGGKGKDATGTAGDGGNGGVPGGGGGGGGQADDGATPGQGGDGGRGEVRVYVYY